MAVTLFHRVINRVRIVNNTTKKPEKRAIKVKNNVKTTKHTITENRSYD